MAGHIYGRLDILNETVRPHMFIKELQIYIEYLIKEFRKVAPLASSKRLVYFQEFKQNLLNGIEYYSGLFPNILETQKDHLKHVMDDLSRLKLQLEDFVGAEMSEGGQSPNVLLGVL